MVFGSLFTGGLFTTFCNRERINRLKTIPELINIFRQGTVHLTRIAEKMDFPWNPVDDDPRRLHNNYVQNLVTCYVSKFAELSDAILNAIDKEKYLVYALAGRSLIETTATLRYYYFKEYKPLLDKGQLSMDDIQALIEIDDKHLRGSRFDWESFLFKRYEKLKEDALKQLQAKKSKRHYISDGIIHAQVNVNTCIEHWADQMPEILLVYNLFCDLVHPNIGSSFLVASTFDTRLYFSRFKGNPVGKSIFEQSFPMLVSATHKPFSDFLFYLMATMWKDEEL